jgi:DNA-directed RNA polymerase specialized sigma24 family protein
MAGFRRGERASIRCVRSGSVPDVEQLFREHWPRAYRAAYLVVHDGAAAEDIAQEAFLAAVRSLERFDTRRPFGPWLHRIVVNRAIDWTRARSLRRELGDEQVGGATGAYRGSHGSRVRRRGAGLRDAVGGIAAEFDPGAVGGAFPLVEGWCCAG